MQNELEGINEMTRAALYLRVSTKRQETDNQLPDLKKLVESRGYTITDIYSEQESAWKTGHQRELARLRAEARLHKYDVVLIWAVDRLSRQGISAIFSIIEELQANGVKVVSCKESWLDQLSPAFIPIFLAISAWMAQYESDRRSERINAGLARVRETGKTRSGNPLGRPKGSHDKEKRKRSNYIRRWENEKVVNKLAPVTTSEIVTGNTMLPPIEN